MKHEYLIFDDYECLYFTRIFSIRNCHRNPWVMWRVNSKQSFISQTYFAPTGWMHPGIINPSRIFHRDVQPPKNPRGVVLTRALRKLSSSADWYGFRSPYFAPPISTVSNLSPSSLPTARKNDGSRRYGAWLRGSGEQILQLSHF